MQLAGLRAKWARAVFADDGLGRAAGFQPRFGKLTGRRPRAISTPELVGTSSHHQTRAAALNRDRLLHRLTDGPELLTGARLDAGVDSTRIGSRRGGVAHRGQGQRSSPSRRLPGGVRLHNTRARIPWRTL